MNTTLIPSFGRRKARKLKVHSQKAYDELLGAVNITGCPSDKQVQDDKEGARDVWLEIGFGGGEHFLAQLASNPDIHMIGCEPFVNGIAKLLAHLDPKDTPRVRLWPDDVRALLEMIPQSYFSRVFILFPDPWPKKRHHKRRLISNEFMDKLLPTLKEGGLLYVASDDVSYVEQIQAVLYHDPDLCLVLGPPSADAQTWAPRPSGWPSTRYEQKALAKGAACAYMIFMKCHSQDSYSKDFKACPREIEELGRHPNGETRRVMTPKLERRRVE